MTLLVITFYVVAMPLQVQYVTTYDSPHLCVMAMDKKLPMPPFDWHTATVQCKVSE